MASSSNIKHRLWLDGCMDFFHYGHSNAILQAKQLGETLVIGIHSDEEITLNKGPPVMTLEERCLSANTCKWVDEVVPSAPYVFDLEWMRRYGCQYVVHGDDISTDANGDDCYRFAKAADQYLEVKRTEGVSTTELLDRLLSSVPLEIYSTPVSVLSSQIDLLRRFATDSDGLTPFTDVFIYNTEKPETLISGTTLLRLNPEKNIIYIDGDWDLFTEKHISALELCTRMFPGIPIMAGIFADEKCFEKPMLNLLERILNLLQCKYISSILVGPPPASLFASSKYIKLCFDEQISKVYYPIFSTDVSIPALDISLSNTPNNSFYKFDKLGSDLIKQRVMLRRQHYEERQRRKMGKNATEQTTIKTYA
ncbi:putative ethanolamine-phosphate cytidylyltransferase [Schizosaccharomyces pombe]|uniref:Probable ethanolamine-phosphate cytidylyltransferase n=1 Tax=Schizosaccharomyces pombe (strain 972 / ATCC 24843) TaxID=284812 RepID=ECT1_SCHPO|nr:putative ethanolamine-phosphate cytidylyltransferase [Schizosaccharomyces pombe]Q9UTI6.1 RecName: Full=Probable ethanolamine-phosphate cytidylyltransferase; AltName: Full=CTP:phosphoethanolamine cytidylyltransferase; AltName: Full=Phosphorylethanolamine transferase [Schizosaccharomyces pombe 972h-]CAB52424.1 ethanolamine-phosphate cytidylyltransferase (predicted) [Schizosaccharomyces pombe]|eukprot:NP_001342902.1 putative ethanolamine-phosphate cytidylyltransferase [Schizosaccharomyces pombe]